MWSGRAPRRSRAFACSRADLIVWADNKLQGRQTRCTVSGAPSPPPTGTMRPALARNPQKWLHWRLKWAGWKVRTGGMIQIQRNGAACRRSASVLKTAPLPPAPASRWMPPSEAGLRGGQAGGTKSPHGSEGFAVRGLAGLATAPTQDGSPAAAAPPGQLSRPRCARPPAYQQTARQSPSGGG